MADEVSGHISDEVCNDNKKGPIIWSSSSHNEVLAASVYSFTAAVISAKLASEKSA
jgi:hypothetical protein